MSPMAYHSYRFGNCNNCWDPVDYSILEMKGKKLSTFHNEFPNVNKTSHEQPAYDLEKVYRRLDSTIFEMFHLIISSAGHAL